MALSKLLRVLRREGLAGIAARLRHRGPAGGGQPTTPPCRLPLTLAPDLPAEAGDRLARAVRQIDPQGLAEAAPGRIVLHLAPAGQGPALGGTDALVFETREALDCLLTLRDDRPALVRGAAGCAALMVATAADHARVIAAGVDPGRVFVLPPAQGQADDVRHLAAGLARWLVAAGALDPAMIDPMFFPPLAALAPWSRLCLGLPESTARRAAFVARAPAGFAIFDGIRLQPGWIGCAASYRTIARAALAQDAVPLIVCEDDMIPAPDFEARLELVRDYLAGQDWDLFSGLPSDVPEDCRIDRIEQRGGQTFLHLGTTAGTVLNIYNWRALQRLADWTPDAGGAPGNTIDRWLGAMPGLRVVTTLPFLAGHDEAAVSTVFGYSNARYRSMIRGSEARLARLAAERRG